MGALGSLRCLPLAAAFADVLAIDAAPSVESDGFEQWVAAPFGGASELVGVVELDDTGSDGRGQSGIVSWVKHVCSCGARGPGSG